MTWELVPETRSLAPAAFADWDTLRTDASGVITGEMSEMIQARIAVLFGGKSAGSDENRSDNVRSCTEAVEQFIMNVAEMTDSQRDGVSSALGAGAYPFYQAVYVYDLDFRLRAALIQLFNELEDPAGIEPKPADASIADLWPALDRFLTDVAAMDRLDPVTTELVRLRGARAHNCRICQSRREVHAVTNGASEATFDQIDFYETSDLDERSKVALRLTDALIWQPAAYPAGLTEQVRATFSPAEALEIVLDVVRNAANKVAVALQADQAVVASGVEFFALESDGSLKYGLPSPIAPTQENAGVAAG
jgi:alkylhydroperoxidase family enzyme